MELIRSTDYFAPIPYAYRLDLLEPNQQLESEAFIKPPKFGSPWPMIDLSFYQRLVADLPLMALAVTSAIVVAMVIINWSR